MVPKHKCDLLGGRACLLGLAATLTVTSIAFAAAGEVEARVFAAGATSRGDRYVMVRDALVRHGEALLPLLAEKAASGDWRERMFARILKLRIEHPQKIKEWRRAAALTASSGKAVRRLGEPDWEKLPKEAAAVPGPLLVDCLWESGNNEARALGAVLQFYLAPSLDVAPAMLESQHVHYPYVTQLIREGLSRLGEPVLPLLRRSLREAATVSPSAERSVRQRPWRRCRRAAIAANVISRLGDRESIPLLVTELEEASGNWEYIQALADALSRLKAGSGLNAILTQLMAAATAHRNARRDSDRRRVREAYDSLRRAVTQFGELAVPLLRERLGAAESEMERILLGGLLAELAGAADRETQVARLRESLWFEQTAADLVRLHRLTGEDVFERLSRLSGGEEKAAHAAFASLKERRAVPLLSDKLRRQHEYFQCLLARRKLRRDAPPLDAQTIREVAYTFETQATDIHRCLAWGDLLLLTLRRIGGEEAKEAIALAAAYPDYSARAGTSLLMLEGKFGEIVARLEYQDRSVREEAALALFERKDRRATAELLRAAARRHGPAHEEWRARVLASRDDVRPVLEAAAKSKEVRERVLAEALLLEIQEPQKAERCKQVVHAAASGVASMHVLSIGMIECAGRGIARKEERTPTSEQNGEPGQGRPSRSRRSRFETKEEDRLDESYVPLLEATCLFGQGIFRRGVAAFALAKLGKSRSMAALVESFNMGSLGVSNPAALALSTFGREGAELAARVPPPTPGERDTGLQMTRHRGGVRVLAERQDVRGVDEILKGLRTLAQDRSLDRWGSRARVYLSAAGRYHDERLVEPLLRILQTETDPERRHHVETIRLLSAYEDERLPPLFVQRLSSRHWRRERPHIQRDGVHAAATAALVGVLGLRAPTYLIERYEHSESERLRAGILLALAQLPYLEWAPYPGESERPGGRFKGKRERAKLTANTREQAYPVLVAALEDPLYTVNRMAAAALALLAYGQRHASVKPDPRAARPLTDWCRRHNTCFPSLTDYLGRHGDGETGRVLVEILRGRPGDEDSRAIIRALRVLKPREAVAVLASYPRDDALRALAEFGKEGADELLKILREGGSLHRRIGAALLLARQRCQPALEPTTSLLHSTIEAGPESDALPSRPHEARSSAYARVCRGLLMALRGLDAEQAKRVAAGLLLSGPKELHPAAIEIWAEEPMSR